MDSNSQAIKKMSVEDAMSVLLNELPKPVRDFVTGPERARIALSLTQKYRLHVDEAGEFERAYMFMLLGIASPEEFVDNLTKAGIAPEIVRALARDVNELVFVPLRKAEQSPVATPVPPTTLPGSNVPVPPPIPHRQEQAPLVPPPSLVQPTAPQMPQYMYAPPQMPQPMMYMPQYGMPYPPPMYVWPQTPQPWPVPQGMSMEHLQQLSAQTPAPAAPVPTQPPHQEAMRPISAPAPSHTPEHTPHPAETRRFNPAPAAPITKEYVSDPYREGI